MGGGVEYEMKHSSALAVAMAPFYPPRARCRVRATAPVAEKSGIVRPSPTPMPGMGGELMLASPFGNMANKMGEKNSLTQEMEPQF